MPVLKVRSALKADPRYLKGRDAILKEDARAQVLTLAILKDIARYLEDRRRQRRLYTIRPIAYNDQERIHKPGTHTMTVKVYNTRVSSTARALGVLFTIVYIY